MGINCCVQRIDAPASAGGPDAGISDLVRAPAAGCDAKVPASVVPIPVALDAPLLRFLLRGVISRAGAARVVEGGLVTGLALGGAAEVAAKVLALIPAAILICTRVTQAIQDLREQRCPRTSRLYRHCTNVMPAMLVSYMIIGSFSGTFGPGVYVAGSSDEAPAARRTRPTS